MHSFQPTCRDLVGTSVNCPSVESYSFSRNSMSASSSTSNLK